jgi:hypothetical protein
MGSKTLLAGELIAPSFTSQKWDPPELLRARTGVAW